MNYMCKSKKLLRLKRTWNEKKKNGKELMSGVTGERLFVIFKVRIVKKAGDVDILNHNKEVRLH